MSENRKRQIIEHIMQLNGCQEELLVQSDFCFNVLRNRYPGLSEAFFKKLFAEHGPQCLLEKLKSLYLSLLTLEELREVLKFWSSPVGKKLRSERFVHAQKTIGTEWAMMLDNKCKHSDEGEQ